jgi:serine/threonine protein kinase
VQLVLCEHVVTIMGFDETADRIVTVLELVGGGDMFTALEKGVSRWLRCTLQAVMSRLDSSAAVLCQLAVSQFTEAAIRSLMSQILGGLLACHAIHVAHRDIKPDNILLVHPTPESPIRIVDFGFAKQCRPESGGGRFDSSLGSPMYKAPEIWDRDARLSRGYTVKADIWSAGVLLFVMLSGQYPFQCEPARHDLSAREHLRQQKLLLSRAVLGGSLSFDEDVWGSVSSLARDLVTRMLVVDSSARLSAAECLQHAWFKATESCSAELVRARRNIVGFNARRKLRAALLAVRATTSSALYKPRTAAATSLPTTTPACSSAAVGAAEGSGKTAQAPSRAAGLLATVDGASASTEAAAPALPASH